MLDCLFLYKPLLLGCSFFPLCAATYLLLPPVPSGRREGPDLELFGAYLEPIWNFAPDFGTEFQIFEPSSKFLERFFKFHHTHLPFEHPPSHTNFPNALWSPDRRQNG